MNKLLSISNLRCDNAEDNNLTERWHKVLTENHSIYAVQFVTGTVCHLSEPESEEPIFNSLAWDSGGEIVSVSYKLGRLAETER